MLPHQINYFLALSQIEKILLGVKLLSSDIKALGQNVEIGLSDS